MKATGMIRHIDELGRIVIPKEMRRQMDIQSNDPVEIFVDGDHILLAKYAPTCIFCGGTENVSLFKDKKICERCRAELAAENK